MGSGLPIIKYMLNAYPVKPIVETQEISQVTQNVDVKSLTLLFSFTQLSDNMELEARKASLKQTMLSIK